MIVGIVSRSETLARFCVQLGLMQLFQSMLCSLLNGASMALYNGSPLVGLNWSNIRCFSSSGEASSVDEYLWLMGRPCCKPIIEYCGGGFFAGSMLQAQSLATFNTPTMGCTLFILGEDGNPIPEQLIVVVIKDGNNLEILQHPSHQLLWGKAIQGGSIVMIPTVNKCNSHVVAAKKDCSVETLQ
eukprot:Gb_27760 [translate_table: standard]